MRPAVFIVAVVLVMAAAAVALSRSSRAAGATGDAQSAELRALREETSRLRAAVASLQESQRGAKAPASGAALPAEVLARLGTMAVPSQPSAADPSPHATPAEEHADMLRFGRYLDDRLAGQRVDLGAASSLRGKAEQYLDGALSLLDVRCSDELCRLKVQHKDLESYRTFQISAFQHESRIWTGPVTFIVEQEADDSGRPLIAGIYLGRGSALPSPEPPR
jgi:hypothetical protein